MKIEKKLYCDFCETWVGFEFEFVDHLIQKHPYVEIHCGRCGDDYFPDDGHNCPTERPYRSELDKFLFEQEKRMEY